MLIIISDIYIKLFGFSAQKIPEFFIQGKEISLIFYFFFLYVAHKL